MLIMNSEDDNEDEYDNDDADEDEDGDDDEDEDGEEVWCDLRPTFLLFTSLPKQPQQSDKLCWWTSSSAICVLNFVGFPPPETVLLIRDVSNTNTSNTIILMG